MSGGIHTLSGDLTDVSYRASTTSATKASPQTNLKDRIAALQRLNNGASNNNLAPPPAAASSAQVNPTRGSLRAKIAKFEQRGGTPIPRGSFGMGAPPPTEDGIAKKKGELLGNRVPGLNRPNGPPTTLPNNRSPMHSPPLSASSPSYSRPRNLSTSGLDLAPYEPRGDMTPGLLSPPLSATVNGMLAAGKGGVDSSPDSGFHSAASSRPNSMVYMRRTVSDSYGAYGMPSPAEVRDDKITVSQQAKPITEVTQLSS